MLSSPFRPASLTGETRPGQKGVRICCCLFVFSQETIISAKALIVLTGRQTAFGQIADRLTLRPPETEFEHGVRRFGYLLMEVTLVLVTAVFAINVYFARPVIESFLFALALSVGLTPQLLPAIISINLSYGAKQMAFIGSS
jgi:Mg2+-importing ATPase